MSADAILRFTSRTAPAPSAISSRGQDVSMNAAMTSTVTAVAFAVSITLSGTGATPAGAVPPGERTSHRRR
ncbi:hypothetical protein D3C83_194060 [compost metagenome]